VWAVAAIGRGACRGNDPAESGVYGNPQRMPEIGWAGNAPRSGPYATPAAWPTVCVAHPRMSTKTPRGSCCGRRRAAVPSSSQWASGRPSWVTDVTIPTASSWGRGDDPGPTGLVPMGHERMRVSRLHVDIAAWGCLSCCVSAPPPGVIICPRRPPPPTYAPPRWSVPLLPLPPTRIPAVAAPAKRVRARPTPRREHRGSGSQA